MTLDDHLARLWPKMVDLFNNPMIPTPELTDNPQVNTAQFEWGSRAISINRTFIDTLSPFISKESALSGILQHEIGHYAEFPRELSASIYLQSRADGFFGSKGKGIYGLYVDMIDELRTLQFGTEDLFALREAAMHMMEAKGTESGKIDATLNRLLLATYARIMPHYASRMPELTKEETRLHKQFVFKPLLSTNLADHGTMLFEFGQAIKDLISDDQKTQQGFLANDATVPLEGKDAPSQHDIDVALDDILREIGPNAYRDAKKYLAKHIRSFKDTPKSQTPGTAKGELAYHNHLIPFYDRWARTIAGTHIIKRPYEKDTTALHPGELKEYEVGDPIHKIDVIASRGIIGIPSITKTRREEEERMPARDFHVPHLNLGIDTSGSMTHPDADSISVLAAFILGRTYHANGAHVGGWNFSTDITFVPPSRDIRPFQQLMCAYYGGGTDLNIQKLEKYLHALHMDDRGLYQMNEKELQQIVEHLPDKKQFMDKNLYVKTPQVTRTLERLDNILITDGYICNAAEVNAHLKSLATVTRNIVFITEINAYHEWKAIEGPNTFVYYAATPKDLMRLAIGQTRKIA